MADDKAKDARKTVVDFLHSLIVKRRYVLISYVLGFFLIGFIVFQKVPMFKDSSGETYLEMEKAFQKWSVNPTDPKPFQKMVTLMKKNPKLSTKYDKIIFQRLLWENCNMANSLNKEAFSRADSDQFFDKFAQGSLLIANGQYEKALNEARALKELISNKNSLLYPYNLLRISFLEKQLGNKKNELLAWQELENYLNEMKEKAKEFLDAYQVDKSKLSEYIEFRKKSLIL
jgi:hypothetical protein